MLYLVGEVFKGAERDAFFRRINNISITDSNVRDDDLRMAFGSKSSWFEQGFLEPNTLAVNELSCFDVINSVYYEIETSPEIIIKDAFILLAHSKLHWFEVRGIVNALTDSTSSLTFIFADMLLAEKELSI